MTGTAADVIRVAKSQVGYHEGYSGGHWNNNQKYSAAVPGLEWSNYQAWCATFCSWVFQEAGLPKTSYPVTASCALGVAWWKKANRFSDYPAIGAQVFFGSGGGSHTGIVYAYDSTYIYTIEGNTNSSGSAEGDGVYLKKRARRDSYVYGYGYPPYAAGIVTADPNWKNPTPPPQEDDMPTADEIAAAVVTKLISGGGVLENSDLTRVAKAVLTTDDLLAAPSDASDYATNKFWTLQTHVQDQTVKGRATLSLLTAQKATIDELVKAVAQLAAGIGDLDPAAIVAELKAAIESIDIHLDVPDAS